MLVELSLLVFLAFGAVSSDSYSYSYELEKPCFYTGKVYWSGDKWKPTPCSRCTCDDGNSKCKFRTCPEIECSGPLKESREQCCPICQGKVISVTEVDYCYWRGQTYSNGEKFSLNPCTDCECNYGEGSCVVRSCPPAPCSNPVDVEGKCCPVCL
ncbi:Cysteine-rich motor neuron 1 protein [Holothuria leucospilota]|uniref:Cysteine-rich motor neuron 1 protein n=1 Tax=Holothuria leucospilota TaxID=206669 RepID=A0A9Q0YFQ4_HOLLE|nr:Cysteine-rich motor neuron 1 protein [Holothuria leucospilota]